MKDGNKYKITECPWEGFLTIFFIFRLPFCPSTGVPRIPASFKWLPCPSLDLSSSLWPWQSSYEQLATCSSQWLRQCGEKGARCCCPTDVWDWRLSSNVAPKCQSLDSRDQLIGGGWRGMFFPLCSCGQDGGLWNNDKPNALTNGRARKEKKREMIG